MSELEEINALRVVKLRIENGNFKLEIDKLKNVVELWKFSNSKLCQKLEQIDEELSRTKTNLLKLRNS